MIPRLARRIAGTLASFALVAGVGVPVAAQAGTLVDLEVVHRSTGQPARAWHRDGRVFVAGAPGDRYAVRIVNRTGARVLAVVSVDGVNVVSGETASPAQAGYVLGPWQSYDITGWRKSQSEIAAFFFTSLGDSYAARTDRPANVGVIGVAAFREWQPPRPRPLPQPMAPQSSRDAGTARADGASEPSDAERASGAPLPFDGAPGPAAAGNASAGAEGEAKAADSARSPSAPARTLQRERIGTGHGERERSDVVTTTFRRASDRADETLAIHYDSRVNLVARGVIPGGPALSEPNPFPGMRFVPDPRS